MFVFARPTALSLALLSAAALAESPSMLFTPTDLPQLRERVESPDLAPLWQKILKEAEGYCTPASPTYTDPAAPYAFPDKGEHVPQSRHDMVMVHRIGRLLSDRMEAIGFAYQITGRQDLGRHGAEILLATTSKYPITEKVVSSGFAGGRGDIMRGLAVGYDLLADQLSDEERTAVANACAAYVEHFRVDFEDPKKWWYKVHNYNGVNGGAAGCLSLAIRDAFPDKADEWIAHCRSIVSRWLDTGFDKEGAYLEGVGYSGYGLSNTVLFADALRRAGKEDLFAHPVFQRLAEFYALSLLPGERVYDARNDSNYAGLGIPPLKLAEAKSSGLYRWLWDNTGSDKTFLKILWQNDVAPIDPATAGAPTAQHFHGRGLCIWRTGWTKEDLMFSIEAGPYYPVTHNQADKGHFTLYGLGYRWAVDPGYANEHEPMGRGQAGGHSCVLVDGQGQARSGAGWGTNGTILKYSNTERCGYALADCTEAYNANNKGVKGAGVLHARRHTFFVYPSGQAPAYAVVLDDMVKDENEHDFTWQMMFSKSLNPELGTGKAVFSPSFASANGYISTPPEKTPEVPEPVGAQPGSCVLTFDVQEAGEYVLWARVRTRAEDRGKADSFYIRMDDAPFIAWHMPGAGSWVWGKVASGAPAEPVTYTLPAGSHRLTIKRREPQAEMDCLVLTKESDAPPELPSARQAPLFMEAESGVLTPPFAAVRPEAPDARLEVHVNASGAATTLETDTYHSMDYHGPGTFPRFRATAHAVNPEFMTVLLPLPSPTAPPVVSFARGAESREITIAWPDHTDTIAWPRDPDKAPTLQ